MDHYATTRARLAAPAAPAAPAAATAAGPAAEPAAGTQQCGIFITLEMQILSEARRFGGDACAQVAEIIDALADLRKERPMCDAELVGLEDLARAIAVLNDPTVASLNTSKATMGRREKAATSLQEGLVARVHRVAQAAGVGVGRGRLHNMVVASCYIFKLARGAMDLMSSTLVLIKEGDISQLAAVSQLAADIDRRAEDLRPASDNNDLYATGVYDLALVCARLGLEAPIAGVYLPDGSFRIEVPFADDWEGLCAILRDRVTDHGALITAKLGGKDAALTPELVQSLSDLCSLSALVALRAARMARGRPQ